MNVDSMNPLGHTPGVMTGVGSLPLEVLVNIFDESLELEVRNVTLISVCRFWRNAVNWTPALWTRISMFTSNKTPGIINLGAVKHRIKMSGNLLLSVQIAPIEFGVGERRAHIIDSFAELDCHRWQSLSVGNLYKINDSSNSVKFDCLRTLTFQSGYLGGRSTDNCDLLSAIMQSSKSLHELQNWPSGQCRLMAAMAALPVLSKLQFFSIKTNAINDLHSSAISSNAFLDAPFWEGLPILEVLSGSCGIDNLLQNTSLNNLSHLKLYSLDYTGFTEGAKLVFPSLSALSIKRGGLPALISLDAPKLISLEVGCRTEYRTRGEVGAFRRSSELENTRILFRDLIGHLLLKPKILHLYTPLTTEVFLFILDAWPQIEELSFNLASPFGWRNLLGQGLKKQKALGQEWKLCPRLRWMELITDWDEVSSEKWKEIARSILDVRCGQLHRIIWLPSNGEVVSLVYISSYTMVSHSQD